MSDFTGNWILDGESETIETRSDPSEPNSMQSRYHFKIERHRIFRGDWGALKQLGTTEASNVYYYTGATQHGALPYTGTQWQCTEDTADHPDEYQDWRTQRQVWECWTAWAAFTPP